MRAAEQFCERHVLLLCLSVPKCVLDSRARHFVAANRGESLSDFRGAAEVLAENQRSKKCANDKPSGFRSFGIEKWTFRGSDFRPAGNAVGEKLDEDDGALASDAKAGFKRRLEAHLELAKGDRLNMHGFPKCAKWRPQQMFRLLFSNPWAQ